jgi:peptidoglycan/xylan/chitin deacetylase (PgdA/CDA1 family)
MNGIGLTRRRLVTVWAIGAVALLIVSGCAANAGPEAGTAASSSSGSTLALARPATASTALPVKQRIALTFDADMYPWMYAQRSRVSLVDLRIVRLLEATRTPATIFVNGLFAKAYPALIQRLAHDPWIELANHSWDHAGWTPGCPSTTPIAAPMTRRLEVTMTDQIVARLTGIRLRYFRFPAFCGSKADIALVRSLGETVVGSTCYFGDTFGWSAARQVASVVRGCAPGAIVVGHLNGPPYHPNTYQALATLIPWWRTNGWTVVTVGTMLGRPTTGP